VIGYTGNAHRQGRPQSARCVSIAR